MKELSYLNFDPIQARQEWQEYKNLLQTHSELEEAKDVLPFFKQRHHLSLLIGYYLSYIEEPNCFGHEFDIFGDFKADLIVGDFNKRRYLLIEFENGKSNSIFKRTQRAVSEWSPRLEKAYSQLTDWLCQLDGEKSTPKFQEIFGNHDAEFQAIIIIGKDITLSDSEQRRLRWRVSKTVIDSKKFQIITFEELLEQCDYYLTRYYGI